MGNRLLPFFLLFSSCAISLSAVEAAEVINLKVGQSGDTGFATYDLAGKIGERYAEVTVALTINGEKFSAEKLTLSGDLGGKVKTGVGKRISWDILADIPTGFDGEVIWNVDTPATFPPVPAGLDRSHPFEFSDKTARDKKTGLIWLRKVSRGGKQTGMMNARSFAARLTRERLAGCTDWRLPTAVELHQLIKYATARGYNGKTGKGYPADYFNAIGFTAVANDYYWTGIGTPGRSAVIDLEDGIPSVKSIEESLQYWPVCSP